MRGAELNTWVTNSKGEMIQSVTSQGAVTRWVPHRCNRSLGRCAYVRIRPDGTRDHRYRMTKAISGGFEYSVFERDGRPALQGIALLDQMGWTKTGSFQTQGQERIDLRQIGSNYRK